ncbi:hypothetical protein HY572_03955 [Candidatus Micrarchaeota archaeon]|nr:hypothetical protein [Candidatus Micrarchaeota archaeon]
MIWFQLLLVLFLALPLLFSFLPWVGVALLYAAFLVAGLFKALSFSPPNKKPAVALYAFFAALSLVLSLGLQAGVVVWVLAVGAVAALGVFFVWLSFWQRDVSCEMLGWTNGFAVLRVPKLLVAWVRPGVYALACPQKPKAKLVIVRFGWSGGKIL